MDTGTLYELIGYVGSALVVISMLMTSVVRLRVINLVGSLIFTCYALLIRSYPTAAMNLFLVGINIWHLVRLLRTKKHYDLIPTDPKDGYLAYLLQTGMDDILTFFPEFSFSAEQTDTAYLVSCDRNPAGMFLGRKTSDGGLEVLLDYTMPVYRDTSAGRFLHDRLAGEGYGYVIFRGNAPKHVNYMEKIGYRKNGRGEYEYRLNGREAGRSGE